MPNKVVCRFLTNVQINGVVPISRDDFARGFEQWSTRIESNFSTRLLAATSNDIQVTNQPNVPNPNTLGLMYQLGGWGGKYRRTPSPDFSIPPGK